MSQSLAVKYRPQQFNDVCSQGSIIKILKRQLETNNITNCYLFSGPSGTGKTTLARIFAREINKGQGSPIEIDAASNNGVDAVRQIIDTASERSIDSEYKIFIIDEAHMETTAAWNAFLKCIEEPPKYTLFMFCTTNPEKIPETILNRVMRLNLSKIPTELIRDRLLYISKQEGFTNYEESCDYISKLADGCARNAIALLEKASNYSMDLNIENVLKCLGNFSYESFFNLTMDLEDRKEGEVIKSIESIYNSGNDLKVFVEQYLDFVLDLEKYCLFKDISCTKFPISRKNTLDYTVNFQGSKEYFNTLLDRILELKNMIKYDLNPRLTVEIIFINICRTV